MASNPGTVYWMVVRMLINLKINEKIKVAEWGTPKKIKFVLNR